MTTIGLYVTRGFQLLCGAVVLGVAASSVGILDDLVAACKYEYGSGCSPLSNWLTALKYASFTGAWGLLDAIVGLVAAFLSAVPFVVPLGFDGLATIFYFAGGINSAVRRSQIDCGDGGDYKNVCTKFTTTAAFMFLGFIASLAAMALVFLRNRSGASRSSTV